MRAISSSVASSNGCESARLSSARNALLIARSTSEPSNGTTRPSLFRTFHSACVPTILSLLRSVDFLSLSCPVRQPLQRSLSNRRSKGITFASHGPILFIDPTSTAPYIQGHSHYSQTRSLAGTAWTAGLTITTHLHET